MCRVGPNCGPTLRPFRIGIFSQSVRARGDLISRHDGLDGKRMGKTGDFLAILAARRPLTKGSYLVVVLSFTECIGNLRRRVS